MEPIEKTLEADITRDGDLTNESSTYKLSPEKQTPIDKYYFNHILFFFYGLSNLCAFSFFLNANDCWMYKFRDTSMSTYNATNRTTLQTYFAASTTVAQSIPSAVTVILVALYGHKIHIRTRVLGIQVISFLMFAVTTSSVLVNTDQWQTTYFYLILLFFVVVTAAALYFQVCLMTLVSKFPLTYSKTQMYGSGAAGIFDAVLQIICLAVSNGSSITAGVIYFGSGAMVFFITLVLAYATKYSKFYRFYIGNSVADTQRKIYTAKEIWDTTKKTWSCHVIFSVSWLLVIVGHPNVSSLVVSEYYNTGTDWNKKYFVPVVTFLSTEVYAEIARIVASPLIKKNNQWLFFIIFLIRMTFLGPVFFFCRTSPKVYSPLWFPHDWQYIIIVAISAFTNSYLLSISFLSIPRLAGEQKELAFILLQTYGSLLGAVVSPLGTYFLRFL